MRAVFGVARPLAREGKRFEKPLEFDEPYDLVVVTRPQIQRVPARTSTAPAICPRRRGARWCSTLKSWTPSFTLWIVVARRIRGCARIHAWRPALRRVHIAFPAASFLTASKDFVTWSAGEILSSDDEKTATILESDAMTNVVRSVNA